MDIGLSGKFLSVEAGEEFVGWLLNVPATC